MRDMVDFTFGTFLTINSLIALKGFLSLRRRKILMNTVLPITPFKGTLDNLPNVDHELFQLDKQTFQKLDIWHTILRTGPPFYMKSRSSNILIPFQCQGDTIQQKEKLNSGWFLNPVPINKYNLIFSVSEKYRCKKTQMNYTEGSKYCSQKFNIDLNDSNSHSIEIMEGESLPVLCYKEVDDIHISDDPKILTEAIAYSQTPFARMMLVWGIFMTGFTLVLNHPKISRNLN